VAVHDWTLVDAGIFHGFHTGWMTNLSETLNGGVLPAGYYAIPEQHAGRYIAHVLTQHTGSPAEPRPPATGGGGGVALAEAPPLLQRKLTAPPAPRPARRTVAIRHVSGHRIVALIEVASPRNKDRRESVADFAAKVEDALRLGIHVLLVDLLPSGNHDPHSLHGAVWELLDPQEYALPADTPLTVASYVGAPKLDVYLHHLAVGGTLPDAPLFLVAERHITVPLEAT
jgi:hypothetical protein